MSLLRAQVVLVNDTGFARDSATNTWHFMELTGSHDTNTSNGNTQLENFYQAIQEGLSSNLSPDVTVKWYDLEDAKPRIPVAISGFTISPGTGAPLPNEVAVCLSFNGDAVAGDNVRRRRGRIYLGPVNAEIMDDGTGDTFVDTDYCNTVGAAADAMRAAGAGGTPQWSVFSPTTAGVEPWSSGDLIAGSFAVTHGHVDNAFDTIRSRGLIANYRNVWP
jgi:hypothetical protein